MLLFQIVSWFYGKLFDLQGEVLWHAFSSQKMEYLASFLAEGNASTQSLQYCYGVITGFRRIDQRLYPSPFVNGATTEVECLESGTAQTPNSWKSCVTGKS